MKQSTNDALKNKSSDLGSCIKCEMKFHYQPCYDNQPTLEWADGMCQKCFIKINSCDKCVKCACSTDECKGCDGKFCRKCDFDNSEEEEWCKCCSKEIGCVLCNNCPTKLSPLLSTIEGWACLSCLEERKLILTQEVDSQIECCKDCETDDNIVKLFNQVLCAKCLENRFCK